MFDDYFFFAALDSASLSLSFSSKCDFRFSLIIFLACFAGAAGAFCAIYFGNWARQELKPLSKHLSGRATATLAPPSES